MTEDNKKELVVLSEKLELLKSALSEHDMRWCELFQSGMTPIEALRESGIATGDLKNDVDTANKMRDQPRLRIYMEELNRCVAARSITTLEAVDAQWADIASVSIADIIEIGELYESFNSEGLPSGAPVQIVKLKKIDELTQAQRSAIKKIKPCSGGVEIELHDKMKALEMLAKRHHGFTERAEINHTGDVQVVTFVGDNNRGPNRHRS